MHAHFDDDGQVGPQPSPTPTPTPSPGPKQPREAE